MFQFKSGYFICALLLFIIEVLIALFVRDEIIRPHIGDLLVIMLIYCFIRSFFKISINGAAVITLLFAYLVEMLQYFKIVEVLGLQKNTFARIVIGTHFSWLDMLAYTAGVVIVLLIEKWKAK